MQVAASYNSCVVLLSNKKLYWWGSNGSIDKVWTPTVMDTHRKVEYVLFSSKSWEMEFSPL